MNQDYYFRAKPGEPAAGEAAAVAGEESKEGDVKGSSLNVAASPPVVAKEAATLEPPKEVV